MFFFFFYLSAIIFLKGRFYFTKKKKTKQNLNEALRSINFSSFLGLETLKMILTSELKQVSQLHSFYKTINIVSRHVVYHPIPFVDTVSSNLI